MRTSVRGLGQFDASGAALPCLGPCGFGCLAAEASVSVAVRPGCRARSFVTFGSCRSLRHAFGLCWGERRRRDELYTATVHGDSRAGPSVVWQGPLGLAAAVILWSGAQGHGRLAFVASVVFAERVIRKTSRSTPESSG